MRREAILSETEQPGTAPKAKVKAKAPRRPRRLPSAPSPGAQRFLDVMASTGITGRALREELEVWCEKKDLKWRSIADYLSGASREFSRPDLLAEFARERTGKTQDPQQFTSPLGVRNFAADFLAKNVASTFLGAVRGTYVCVRPGTHVLAGTPPSRSGTIDEHELELLYHGDSQPGTFTYTTTANGVPQGSWNGYAVTKFPYIFLSGFCVEGEDASYFLLRPHPSGDYSTKMLVGIQSLLLSHPRPGDAKHAVSRHIVAIKNEFAASKETLAAANQWIKQNRETSGGLLVNLGDYPSAKT